MQGGWDLLVLKCLRDAREGVMFKPIKIMELKWGSDGPHGFLCGMSFHSMVENKGDRLSRVVKTLGQREGKTWEGRI